MDYTSISVEAKRFEKKANDDKEISEMPKKIAKKIEEGISCISNANTRSLFLRDFFLVVGFIEFL